MKIFDLCPFEFYPTLADCDVFTLLIPADVENKSLQIKVELLKLK